MRDKIEWLNQLDDCELDPFQEPPKQVRILTAGSIPGTMDIPIAFRIGNHIMLATLCGLGYSRDQMREAMKPHEASDEELIKLDSYCPVSAPYRVVRNLIAIVQEDGLFL